MTAFTPPPSPKPFRERITVRHCALVILWFSVNTYHGIRFWGWLSFYRKQLFLLRRFLPLGYGGFLPCVVAFQEIWDSWKMTFILLQSHLFLKPFPRRRGDWGYTYLVLEKLRTYFTYLFPTPRSFQVLMYLIEGTKTLAWKKEDTLSPTELVLRYCYNRLVKAQKAYTWQLESSYEHCYESLADFCGAYGPALVEKEEGFAEWLREYFSRESLKGYAPRFNSRLRGLAYYLAYAQRRKHVEPPVMERTSLERICWKLELKSESLVEQIVQLLRELLEELRGVWDALKLSWPPKNLAHISVLAPLDIYQFRSILELFIHEWDHNVAPSRGGIAAVSELFETTNLPGGLSWGQVLQEIGRLPPEDSSKK